MTHPNLELINQFFELYGTRDMEGLRRVLSDDVTWTFPGQHPLSGTQVGIAAVVAFFDAMGQLMTKANVQAEQLVVGANDNFVVQCQHIATERAEGANLDHLWCVLWEFADGKIIAGQHLAADQHAVDAFFQDAAR